ncbi:MAG TPA: DUF5302 domain-containing protein [Actinocrinis sp.]|nr:DUF5302 domain-containing protein [Actinocrinis sp.]
MTTQEQNEPTAPQDEGDLSPAELTKRKFQEALARKHAKEAERHADGDGSGSAKVGNSHGPMANQRNYRRKSG